MSEACYNILLALYEKFIAKSVSLATSESLRKCAHFCLCGCKRACKTLGLLDQSSPNF